ncbi:hypothetical protein BGZ73_006173 [Actinomortierella ambigua]|nr:hypothetical protein BGZ73_006173 [Actinomortierella ambigua]
MDQSNAGRRSSTSDSGDDARLNAQRSAQSRMSSFDSIRAQRQGQPLQEQQYEQSQRGRAGERLGLRYADMNSDWIQFS